jgi:hypothetical protein
LGEVVAEAVYVTSGGTAEEEAGGGLGVGFVGGEETAVWGVGKKHFDMEFDKFFWRNHMSR